ncbi:hypothetical protein MRX96_020117 [Rhipicephalus microplus]
MPEAMVDGETITEEEASAPGWINAIRRRSKLFNYYHQQASRRPLWHPVNRSCDDGCSRQPTAPAPNGPPPCHCPSRRWPGYAGITKTNRPKETRPRNSRRPSEPYPDSTDEGPAYQHQEPDCNAYLGRSSHR